MNNENIGKLEMLPTEDDEKMLLPQTMEATVPAIQKCYTNYKLPFVNHMFGSVVLLEFR